jgi:hypothetical protein
MYDLRGKVEKLKTEVEEIAERNRNFARAGFTANGEIVASFIYTSIAHDLALILSESEEASGEELLD